MQNYNNKYLLLLLILQCISSVFCANARCIIEIYSMQQRWIFFCVDEKKKKQNFPLFLRCLVKWKDP